ncbi:hypothetical protein L0P62_01820 [Anaerosalibacter bizertensis]|nr:hypothetical protein [Anaerosalibacter bizertensis]
MGLDPVTQSRIYIQYWNPIENMFNYENQSTLMDDFFRDYITSIEGQIPTKSLVYENFKRIYNDLSHDTVEDICSDIYKSAKLYTNMHYARDESMELNSLFRDIKSLKMNFDEIDDPHKIGRDVTNIGTWGNGNMEILMDSVNQIPSILYIIGQSYDKQLN